MCVKSLIVPYDPDWKTRFEDLKQILTAALSHFQIDIQHVGSTSIPGLCAKPILDIDIVLSDREDMDAISVRLEELGYKNAGEQGIAGRFAFKQLSGRVPVTPIIKNWQEHHLYVCYADSLALKNHLVFRNALLTQPELTNRYAQLKEALVKDVHMTREDYTKRKTEFIISVLASAGLDEKELNEITKANI